MLAGGEECRQTFFGLGSEACLAESDGVKAKRERAISNLGLG
jgi:hypothetical protein